MGRINGLFHQLGLGLSVGKHNSLVRDLVEGPIDFVGDVHGDAVALESLLTRLGYDAAGVHPDSRTLVFVGDLVDRGPDSPAVVKRVNELVDNQKAQCVLGNHELNLLLDRKKFDNGWFFGEEFVDHSTGKTVEQVLADEETRTEIVDFLKTLPLVLRRNDVRIVHACWQPEMVAMVSGADEVVEYYRQHRYNIDLGLALRADLEAWQREQRHQNLNPVKVLTSGLKIKSEATLEENGKASLLERYPWWRDYNDEPICFFGHYNRPYGFPRDQSRAICVDYGVSRRWLPKQPGDDDPEKWRLAAVRYPELTVVFDNGDEESLSAASVAGSGS